MGMLEHYTVWLLVPMPLGIAVGLWQLTENTYNVAGVSVYCCCVAIWAAYYVESAKPVLRATQRPPTPTEHARKRMLPWAHPLCMPMPPLRAIVPCPRAPRLTLPPSARRHPSCRRSISTVKYRLHIPLDLQRALNNDERFEFHGGATPAEPRRP